MPPPDADSLKPGKDGISDAMLEFNWERDIQSSVSRSPPIILTQWFIESYTIQAIKIDWKDASKNLAKLHPPKKDEEDPNEVLDFGSFFNIFELSVQAADVSPQEHLIL